MSAMMKSLFKNNAEFDKIIYIKTEQPVANAIGFN